MARGNLLYVHGRWESRMLIQMKIAIVIYQKKIDQLIKIIYL